MVDIWKYASEDRTVRVHAVDGKQYTGKILAVWDTEELCDNDEDCLAVFLENGTHMVFAPSEIDKIEIVGKQ